MHNDVPDQTELDMLRSAMASAVALPPLSSVTDEELENFIASIPELTGRAGLSTKRFIAQRIVQALKDAGMMVVKQ